MNPAIGAYKSKKIGALCDTAASGPAPWHTIEGPADRFMRRRHIAVGVMECEREIKTRLRGRRGERMAELREGRRVDEPASGRYVIDRLR